MSSQTGFVRWISSWALALALLAVSSDGRKVCGQVLAVAQPVEALPDDQFEMWVFDEEGNAKTARRNFETMLKLGIEEIDRECRLTEDQKRKLQLMGMETSSGFLTPSRRPNASSNCSITTPNDSKKSCRWFNPSKRPIRGCFETGPCSSSRCATH